VVSTPQAQQTMKKKKQLPMQQPQPRTVPSLEVMASSVRSWSLSRARPDPPSCLTRPSAAHVLSQATWISNPIQSSGSKTPVALHPPFQEANATVQAASPTQSPRPVRGLLPRCLVPCRRLIPT
jgi:hypothetical protein